MSTTLNGNLMGSVSLLGLIDAEIKRDRAHSRCENQQRKMIDGVGEIEEETGLHG